jgi:transcriptional regulator with XRE-family HTH domain
LTLYIDKIRFCVIYDAMKIDQSLLDDAVLKELGRRLMAIRLAQNLTQGELATRAGLGLRTIQRLEQGEAATQLSGFVRVCRALGLMERLDALLVEPPPSPIDQLRLQERKRRRASGRRRVAPPAGKWTWGESS